MEDLKTGAPGVESIQNSKGDIVTGDSVLEVLCDFYQELYSKNDHHCEDEILNFLNGIPEIPKLMSSEINNMGKPITEDKVLKAIFKLKTGKAPGTDGITAALYKKFAGAFAPVLVDVFNEAFQSMDLPSLLKVAIIILLYKKRLKR